MQFWQSCLKICTRSPKKTFEPKTFSNEGFRKKYSSEIMDSSFGNPAEIFQPKPEEPSWYDKNFQTKVFSKVVPQGIETAVLTILPQIFRPKLKETL